MPLIEPSGVTNFIKFLIEIQALSFNHMHLNVASGKWLTVFQVPNELKRCLRHVRKNISFLIKFAYEKYESEHYNNAEVTMWLPH